MNVTRSSLQQAKERIAKSNNPTGNACHCGSALQIIATGRSIWFRPFTGGEGEVRQVGEIFCPACDGDRRPPTYGTPIYEDEIVDIGSVEPLTHA